MANSDGQVRIIIDTNANEAVKALNDTSKAFDNSAKKARQAATVYGQFEQENTQLVEKLREIALAGGQNGTEFKRLAGIYRENKKALEEADSVVQKATGGLRNQQSGMSSLTSMATKLISGYVGLQGAIKAFNFSMESVDAFRVQERAVASLNTTLKNADVYSAEYSAKIQELASSIQSYSNYGDEAIIKAQALGQSFAGQVPFTENATKAVVDFAAATGMDLEQAFTLVGKSVGSSTNALGRYGVELQKGMTDSQKMEAITKQLGDRYKGQAAQMADANVQLKNSIGDLKEAFGSTLNGYVTNWQNGMAKIVRATTNAINTIRILNAEKSSLNTSELQKRIELNERGIANLDKILAKNPQNMPYQKRRAELIADNNLIKEQIKWIEQRERAQAKVKPIKFSDESYSGGSVSTPTSKSAGGSSNARQMKDDYEKLQSSVQAARREIELAAIAHGTSSNEVQQAFVKYNQLNTELSNINSLFDTQTVKVEQQKGAYQLLNDNVTSLTAKLRDLAAENQVGSTEWINYKSQLQEAQTELDNVNKSLTDNGVKLEDYGKQISSSLSSGLVNALRNGGNAFDAFSSLATTALQKVLDKLIEISLVTPVLNAFTGGTGGTLFSGIAKIFGSANGNVFQNGNVIPFAKGGVVNKPTIFPMANGGTGLMSEAGAEAVMPLRRMSNGRLGVEAENENGKAVNVNIYNQSGANVETRKRDDGSMDIFIRKVNEALSSERTSSGFRSAYVREDRKGVQAA